MRPHTSASLKMLTRRNSNRRFQEHDSVAKKAAAAADELQFSVQHLQKSCDFPLFSAIYTRTHTLERRHGPVATGLLQPSTTETREGDGRWKSGGNGDENPLLIKLRKANTFSEKWGGGWVQLDKYKEGRAGAAVAG